jgi:hypothetical protein
MRLLLALDDGRVVGMVAWALTHELYSGEARVYTAIFLSIAPPAARASAPR